MSEQTPAPPAAPVVPDPAVTPPAAAATPPPVTPPAPTLANTPADQLDPEKLRALVLTQREKEATLTAENAALKAAKAELDTLKAAQLTDQERAVQRAEEAEALAVTAKEQLRSAFLLAELAKADHGIVDAEAAATLITGVEYGDDGRPTNAAERIAALLEAKGFLKATAVPVSPRAPNVNGGSGTAGAAPPNLSAEQIAFAQKIGKTPEQYAAWLNVSTATDAAALATQNKT